MRKRHRLDEVLLKSASVAVSILTMSRTRSSNSRLWLRLTSAMRAPSKRRSQRDNLVRRAIRHQSQDQRVERIDVTAERTREQNARYLLHARVRHQQPRARMQRALRQLHGADVVLRDGDSSSLLLVENIDEAASLALQTRRFLCSLLAEQSVCADQSDAKQLSDSLDDAGAANAGDLARL